MALKDNAALVKMYAMVNVEQYRIVATGYTVEECKKNYIQLLSENSITEASMEEYTEKTSVISDIREAVIDGNTYYYLKLDDGKYYSVKAKDYQEAITLNAGSSVTVKFSETENAVREIAELVIN